MRFQLLIVYSVSRVATERSVSIFIGAIGLDKRCTFLVCNRFARHQITPSISYGKTQIGFELLSYVTRQVSVTKMTLQHRIKGTGELQFRLQNKQPTFWGCGLCGTLLSSRIIKSPASTCRPQTEAFWNLCPDYHFCVSHRPNSAPTAAYSRLQSSSIMKIGYVMHHMPNA